jgi:hypothetical protein
MAIGVRPIRDGDTDRPTRCVYDPAECTLQCPGTSRSQMEGRTGAYPHIFPCREAWADAVVQSAAVSCSETHPEAAATCFLELDILFADYLFGNITASVTFASGPLSGHTYTSVFDIGDPNTQIDSNVMASLTIDTIREPCHGPAGRTTMIRTVEHVEVPFGTSGSTPEQRTRQLVESGASLTVEATTMHHIHKHSRAFSIPGKVTMGIEICRSTVRFDVL